MSHASDDLYAQLYPEGSWELDAARDLRDRFVAWVERHEQEDHGGDVCHAERIGLLAFLAHCIGVTSMNALEYWASFILEIQLYEREHKRRHDVRGNGHAHAAS